MSTVKLIADSGATKAEWCVLQGKKTKTIFTQGISPYFFNTRQITEILQKELLPSLKGIKINEVYYYGTGCINPNNNRIVRQAIRNSFNEASSIEVTHDVMAAARALFGRDKGVACILGTGSSSCYYNGRRIAVNRPGLGYVLGDEGSGAYLGKKVLQYFLYGTFDEELAGRFSTKYQVDATGILENIYKKPLANRYLASFTPFLSENRGHYMIENIIEDGLNDFFFYHICKFKQSWTSPISFIGGVAHHFRDVVGNLCRQYEFSPGKILKNPMEGLIEFHR
ncbi:MAG: N-acetylglucosamine kinase [Chitinophagaceae bacterium]|nr:N-acetylglucosamine kinase [Chitinophagaceae bacterium]